MKCPRKSASLHKHIHHIIFEKKTNQKKADKSDWGKNIHDFKVLVLGVSKFICFRLPDV